MPADQVLINLLGVVDPLHGVRTLDLIQLLQMYVHASTEKALLKGEDYAPLSVDIETLIRLDVVPSIHLCCRV